MSITPIPLSHVALSFLPLLIVVYLFFRWSLNWKELIYATLRMVVQLITIGYLLHAIFNQNNLIWTTAVVLVMLFIAAWISLRSIKTNRKKLYWPALFSLALGSLSALFWTTVIVLPDDKWNDPKFVIPLGGMFLSNSLNTIGVAVERYFREIEISDAANARNKAFEASLIREVNMYFAVGLVSLPGLLTGQILSGVDPLIAVRYQIIIMTMVMSSCAISASSFLYIISQSRRALKPFSNLK